MKKNNNTLAHVENTDDVPNESRFSYDPKIQVPEEDIKDQPTDLHNEVKKEELLEDKNPDKGYSTDPEQSKTGASQHLADEDMDKPGDDPIADAKNLKESYEMAKEN